METRISLLLVSAFLTLNVHANSPNTWTIGEPGKATVYTAATIDCYDKEDVSSLLFQGEVTLKHPEDNSLDSPAKTIAINCGRLGFQSGTKILSDSNLEIRIDGKAFGDVFIESTRGTKAKAGATGKNIGKAARGSNGANGGGGRKAYCPGHSLSYPNGRSSRTGGSGTIGTAGAHGKEGSNAANGLKGSDSANVYFRVARGFDSPDQELIIKTTGGLGGVGGKGGSGQIAGDGGKGGNGGKGGKACGTKGASNGGNGGNGGKGGNGGAGQYGATGGNGGNGGRIDVILGVGGYPPIDMKMISDGGLGGDPGLGGNQGIGGDGGAGGSAGCGGSAGGIFDGDGGDCGGKGSAGAKGADGSPGGDGNYGKNGVKGQCTGTIYKFGNADALEKDQPIVLERISC